MLKEIESKDASKALAIINDLLNITDPAALRIDLRYLIDFYLVNHDENEMPADRQEYYEVFITIDQMLMDIENILKGEYRPGIVGL